MSQSQIGEFATDYVEVRRDYTDWTPVYDKDMPAPPTAGDRHGHPETSVLGPHLSHASHSQLESALMNGTEGAPGLAPIAEKTEHENGNGKGPIEEVL